MSCYALGTVMSRAQVNERKKKRERCSRAAPCAGHNSSIGRKAEAHPDTPLSLSRKASCATSQWRASAGCTRYPAPGHPSERGTGVGPWVERKKDEECRRHWRMPSGRVRARTDGCVHPGPPVCDGIRRTGRRPWQPRRPPACPCRWTEQTDPRTWRRRCRRWPG